MQPKLHAPLGSSHGSRHGLPLVNLRSEAGAPVADDDQEVVDVGIAVTVSIAFISISTPVAQHNQDVIDIDELVAVVVTVAGRDGIDHIDVTKDGAVVDDLDGPVLRINGPDVPAPYARNIEQAMIPSSDQVVEAVKYNFGL